METLDVTFGLVTPAFAGAASTARTDGLRPPALKALLRFWWRTRYGDLATKDLLELESSIFGSHEASIGQGLRLIPGSSVQPADRHVAQAGGEEKNPLFTYMAYGPIAWNRDAKRPERKVPMLSEDYRLKARIRWRVPGSDSRTRKMDILASLWLLSAFGGYGSRARRGWGSLAIAGVEEEWRALNLPDPHGFRTRNQLLTELQMALRNVVLPAESLKLPYSDLCYTAFSKNSRVLIGPPSPDAMRALSTAKQHFEEYRRGLGAWHDHKTPNDVGPDHQLRSRWLKTPPASGESIPKSAVFGLPHNAGFRKRNNAGKKVPGGPLVEVNAGDELQGRRASPLFFKVLRCGSGAVPVLLFLPARFLDPGLPLNVRIKDAGIGPTPVTFVDYGPINDFIHGSALQCYSKDGRSANWEGLLNLGWTQVL